MAKKSKRNTRSNPAPEISISDYISKETLNAIFGVLSLVTALFLLMGSFDIAGRAGTLIYRAFSYLFGIGYYLMPMVLLTLSASFFQARENKIATTQVVGSTLFFISSLGIIALFFPASGGVAGRLIATPLSLLFGPASSLIMVAIMIISIMVIFDTSIKFEILSLLRKIFRRKEVNPDTLGDGESGAVDRAVENLSKQEKEDSSQDASSKPLTASIRKDKIAEGDGFMPLITKRSGKSWSPPPLSLLERDKGKPGVGDIKANANLIKRTMLNFGIVVEMDEISIGPSVTRYALKPAEGVKLSKILGLQNNLELALAAHPVRIEAPIPGKSLVGIEVPNTTKSMIGLGSLVSEDGYTQSEKPLLVALGRDISGHSHFSNLAKMPHMLIAGATGSGKSVTIHAIINSLLFRNPPENLKFIMIDPKRVELTLYNQIPHLLTPVITDPKKAIMSLKWAAKEMERRYQILEKESVRDIDSYHKNVLLPYYKKTPPKEGVSDGPDTMPYIVVIIDELADLMQSYPRELEASIVRLAQMSRAVGIHLILSTQRPSVNIITGLIKANIPSRIALQVSSQIDSRTILDAAGAEKLLGAGDMLYMSGEMSKPVRVQSAFISETEVKGVVNYLREAYIDELQDEINFSTENTSNAVFSASLEEDSFDGDDDELYEEARAVVLQTKKASTSFLQRKLRIGYARAARLIDILEERGVVGPGSGAKPREVYSDDGTVAISSEEEEEI